jgi:hypothetical protein
MSRRRLHQRQRHGAPKYNVIGYNAGEGYWVWKYGPTNDRDLAATMASMMRGMVINVKKLAKLKYHNATIKVARMVVNGRLC